MVLMLRDEAVTHLLKKDHSYHAMVTYVAGCHDSGVSKLIIFIYQFLMKDSQSSVDDAVNLLHWHRNEVK